MPQRMLQAIVMETAQMRHKHTQSRRPPTCQRRTLVNHKSAIVWFTVQHTQAHTDTHRRRGRGAYEISQFALATSKSSASSWVRRVPLAIAAATVPS